MYWSSSLVGTISKCVWRNWQRDYPRAFPLVFCACSHSKGACRRLPKSALPMDIVPLYAGLTTDEQLRAFSPTERGRRKVVVSTNIAEASVTIEGIRYVIDCGLVKVCSPAPIFLFACLTTVRSGCTIQQPASHPLSSSQRPKHR